MKKRITAATIMGALLALMMIMASAMVPGHSGVMAEPGGQGVVDLVLLPPHHTVNAGDTFDVTIEAQRHGQEIHGIDVFLNFDPTYLEVESITPGVALDIVLVEVFDNDAGTLGYSAGRLVPPFPGDTFDVAVVTFRAKAGTDSTPISFHHDSPRQTLAVFDGVSKLDETIGATVTITDVASPRYALTVTVDPAESGTVSLIPEQPVDGYEAGTEVTLTTEPAAGWEFDRWRGDVAGTDPTITLTMDADNSVTAHFTEEVVPDVVPPEVGSVSPEDDASDMTVGTSISVTFSKAMDKAAVEGAFTSKPEIPGTFIWVDHTLTFDPEADLARGTTYTISISTAAKDLAGNGLTAPYTWSFTTEPEQQGSLWWIWLIIGILILAVLISFLGLRKKQGMIPE